MPGRWTVKPPYGTPIDRSHPLAQGLLGFWSLNEGASAAAYNAVRGDSLAGTAISWTGGNPTFDGTSSRFTAPAANAIYTSNNFTVAAAVYPTTLSGNREIFRMDDTISNRLLLLRFVGANSVGRIVGGTAPTVTSGTSFATNAWAVVGYSCAMSGTTPGLALYTNGRADGTATGSGGPFIGTAAPIYIGAAQALSEYFAGSIAWVGYWGRALSAQEHAAIGASPDAIWRIFRPRHDTLLILGSAVVQDPVGVASDTSTLCMAGP